MPPIPTSTPRPPNAAVLRAASIPSDSHEFRLSANTLCCQAGSGGARLAGRFNGHSAARDKSNAQLGKPHIFAIRHLGETGGKRSGDARCEWLASPPGGTQKGKPKPTSDRFVTPSRSARVLQNLQDRITARNAEAVACAGTAFRHSVGISMPVEAINQTPVLSCRKPART